MSRGACVVSSSSTTLRFFEDTTVDASEGAEDDFRVAEPERRVVEPAEDFPASGGQLAFKKGQSLARLTLPL